ncbi:MAG: hypothetical protein C0448_02515 [Sphingobacteriaceae bacterium]|nr:hypothetical protein [Sphingobacteriaceae bacterium]
MKNLIFVFFLILSSFKINAGVLIVEGKFQNKNIYIQNSFGGNGVGFCATEIKVNGKITTDEVNSSAFEIDLAAMNIKPGQKVIIEISHKSDCMPVVLNPEVLKPRPTFEVVSMNINSTGVLKWTAKNESGSLPYVIEQFKWNKWVYVGEVQGVGSPENHDYSFQVSTHSGENKFRIKQVGLGSTPKLSSAVILNSNIDKPSFMITKDNKAIQYTNETAFEIYDAFGSIVKKGFGKEINIENLAKGKYYLCYDNQVTEFDKKK